MSAGKSNSVTITISEQERAELSDILTRIVQEAHEERRRTEDPDYQKVSTNGFLISKASFASSAARCNRLR